MALKQAKAVAALAAAGQIINTSLCELNEGWGWLALVETAAGTRLAWAVGNEEAPLGRMFAAESTLEAEGVAVKVMALNANNAAVVRRFVKWAAPSACGTKGTSIGFSDWLGAADAAVVELFAKRQLKPVLVDYTPEDSQALKRNFLEAVDTATWGVLKAGYKEGYGAIAAGLKSEEDIVKALLYGYSMVGLDCSEKIDLAIEKLSDKAVEERFNQFNDEFKKALEASYLNAEFKVNNNSISFTAPELRRIVLEYGEAIMHVQFLYNSYLKSTPWDIDFELSLSKPGKVMTPQEHYLVANELQRNGIKLAAICIDPLEDQEAVASNLQIHCDIADTFGYRLSIKNADLAVADPSAAMKGTKGKLHLKLNNVLWLAAVELLAVEAPDLYKQVLEAAGVEAQDSKGIALSYTKVLNPEAGELAAKVKEQVLVHKEAYAALAVAKAGMYMKQL